MTGAELLAHLRGGITADQWSALEAGGLRVSAFNRAALLEMRTRADAPAAVDEIQVRGLRDALEAYLGRYLADDPGAWPWIVTACLYLAFIARRPMHPVELLGIRQSAEAGRTVYACPMKSPDPGSACRYCVCVRAPKEGSPC